MSCTASTSKRQRVGSNVGCTTNLHERVIGRVGSNVDRITNLHRSVIGHVLSRLPTEEAVRTSILSRAWRMKWTNLYNVVVDNKYEQGCNQQSFIQFMNRIYKFSGSLIRNLHLTCWNHVKLRYLQKWISDALLLDIECFEVNITAGGIVYPYDLLNSTVLRELSLAQQIGTLQVAAVNCAANLTSLNLSRVEIVNGDPYSSTMILSFPVLVTFTAVATKWLKLNSVEIYAPSLTEFTSKPQDEGRDYTYSITIVAHSLIKFTCSYGLPENISLNGSSVVCATLNSDSPSQDLRLLKTMGSRASNLINRFTNLEELELSSFMVEVSQIGPPLHLHHKLTRLSFLRHVRMEPLFDLLNATPSLKFLTLYAFDLDDYDYGRMRYLPSCIVSHLLEVVLRDFDCQVAAYNLARFLFRSTNHLKKFIIVGNYHRREEIEKILSTFNRASTRLTFEVRKGY